jgi:alkanesulfonate monooxygenase SsuD/methylene tetrahydromethanopterin reductase-like flavin-dependent oxidoreductase (luciferase family)
MKFGLFYELSVPRPWTRESERIVYNNALEQVKLADELGFDQVWAVEHHFRHPPHSIDRHRPAQA